jgi:glutaredoxin 3
MPKIEVYTTPFCPYCVRAKSLLNAKGVEFEEFRVDMDPKLWEEMEKRSQRNTVPQIFIDQFHVGGFDDMAALENKGELDQLLGL